MNTKKIFAITIAVFVAAFVFSAAECACAHTECPAVDVSISTAPHCHAQNAPAKMPHTSCDCRKCGPTSFAVMARETKGQTDSTLTVDPEGQSVLIKFRVTAAALPAVTFSDKKTRRSFFIENVMNITFAFRAPPQI